MMLHSAMTVEPIEAAGDLASGALLARAIEPAAGEAGAAPARGRCLNCGAALATRYCGDCGQSAHIHATLASIGHDLLHGLFHFEGKIWRTIPDLLIRPGELTRRYIAGERAKFVSPLALFLFALFLMFATFESAGVPFRPKAVVTHNGRQLAPAEVSRMLAGDQAKIAGLRKQMIGLPSAGAEAGTLRGEIAAARGEASALALADRINNGVADVGTLAKLPLATGWSSLDRRIKAAASDPALLALKLQANAHKFAWALIPLSVPFLWLVFVRSPKYRLYDHTIFITYALSAVMLLMAAIALMSAMGIPVSWAPLLIALHQYRQLRQAYRLTWWGALWRTVWLQIAAVAVIGLFTVALLASGLID